MSQDAERISGPAPAKINLGLKILGKRPDGFHNLESVFIPLDLEDRLEVELSSQDSFSCSDPDLPQDGSNLVLKARDIWRREAKLLGLPSATQPLAIHLEKRIPAGAGMGGGSSDAASCLMLLNRLFSPALPDETLSRIALELGSDLPFFLLKGWAHVSGRGEVLVPLEPFFTDSVLIHWPGIHVPTGPAYAELSRILTQKASYATFRGFREFVGKPLARVQWPGNDFEQAVFGWHSELADLKARMLNAGASYAAMSGSGSTLFGLFDSVQSARQAAALLPQNEGKSFICQPRRQAWIP